MKAFFTPSRTVQTSVTKTFFAVCFLLFGMIARTSAQSDNCANAPVLNIGGTCNPTNFEISGYSIEGAMAAPSCGGVVTRDGWYRFTTDDYTQYTFQGYSNRSYSIAVYQGTCGALTQVVGACMFANQNTASNMTITLAPNTTYYLRISLRGNIGGGAGITGTICISKYCLSAGTTTYNTGIRLVRFNTINNPTPANKTAGYSSFLNLSTQVVKGNSYPLTVNLNTDGNVRVYAYAWIDWNKNGVFENSERYDLGSTNNQANGQTSGSPFNITIPSTALSGTTVMRVSAKYNGYPTACETGFDGEVEDYSVEVLNQNASISSFSPASGCVGSSVNITGMNFNSATDVLINAVSATSFTINSNTSITAVIPTTTTGRITVVTPTNSPVSATNFTVLATPADITIAGAGTFCAASIVTATGGTGGTIYFQGTNPNGTVTNLGGATQTISTSGTYYFRSYNGTCWGNSASVVMVINSIPPAATTVAGAGAYCGTTTITAAAGAGGTIYFQGTTSGGTSTASAVTTQTITSSGTYYFRSYNGCSWGPEGSAVVTINTIPSAVTITGGGLSCGSATLTATGGTGGTIYFQGTTADGTATNLGSTPQTVTTAGTYYFRSRSSAGCWGPESSVAVSFVASATFATHPTNKIACTGQNTNFTVTVNGGPVTYQWRKGTNNITNGGSISGANIATLTITGITLADAAEDYNCVITDACGTVVSNYASLTVNVPAVAPTTSATGLSFITSATSIVGSFTAANDASAYLVIRTATSTAPTNPVNGVNYAEGTNALGGFVVSNSASTSFYSTGLAQNTNYYYWIYSYNVNSCGTTPLYYNVPLSGNATTGSTVACGTVGNLYWAGLGSQLGQTASNNLNLASNWSTTANTYNASPFAPTSCTNVFIEVKSDEILFFSHTDPKLTLTGNLQVHNLTYNANQGTGWFFVDYPINTVAEINVNGYKLDVFGDAKIDMTSNDGNTIGIGDYNASSAGLIEFKADVAIGVNNYTRSISAFVGNNNSKITFKGSVTLGKTSSVATATAPGTVIFDGTAQLLTWANTENLVNFKNVQIGTTTTSTTSLILAGSIANAITGNLELNGASILNLSANQWNRSAAGGTFNLKNNSKLILGRNGSTTGSGVTVVGSNFPGGFVATLSNTSTVEYNGIPAMAQSINVVPTYGNLTLSNSAGSGTSVKSLTASLIGIAGDLTVLPFATFNMANFNANRTSVGGTFTMAANAKLSLTGTTGGASANNNFPNNFSTKTFNYLSSTTYEGTDQGIYGGVVYGAMILTNTGTKTAPNELHLTGHFSKTGTTSFAHNNGSVFFDGSLNQSFNSTVPEIVFNNLANNNLTSLSVNANFSLLKELKLGAASRLALGAGNVTLLSSATSTANVAEIPSNAIITYASSGRFNVERYINTGLAGGQHTKGWQFVAANVAGVSIRNSWMESGNTNAGYGTYITDPSGTPGGYDAVSATPSLKYYNAATDTYFSAGNANSNDIKNDFGYMLYVRGDRTVTTVNGNPVPTTLRAKGTLITGAKNVNVPSGKFQSVGNPYASAIDFEILQANSTGIDGVFYVWDPSISGTFASGGYQTFSEVTGYIGTGGGSTIYLNNTKFTSIQSGQAFYVKNATGGGTVKFTEAVKIGGSKLVNRTGSSNKENIAMFTTMLVTNSNLMADQNRVVFDNNYSNNVDELDAIKVVNAGENFSLRRQQKNLVVEARRQLNANDTLQFNMAGMQTQSYNLVFAVQNLYAPGLSAELVDKFTNTRMPVSLNDTTIVPFTVNSTTASKAADRFMIVFRAIAGPLPVNMTSISAVRNDDRSIAINWKVENELNLQKYEIQRSADGQQFTGILTASPTAINGGSAAYSRNDLSPLANDNYYRIKATSINGLVQYSAIVKVAPIKAKADIGVYPNPVVGKNVHIRFTSQAEGEYNVQITNKIGQVIYKGKVEVIGSVFTKSIQLSENAPSGSYQLQISNNTTMTTQQILIAD